jgi:hypothetical protein
MNVVIWFFAAIRQRGRLYGLFLFCTEIREEVVSSWIFCVSFKLNRVKRRKAITIGGEIIVNKENYIEAREKLQRSLTNISNAYISLNQDLMEQRKTIKEVNIGYRELLKQYTSCLEDMKKLAVPEQYNNNHQSALKTVPMFIESVEMLLKKARFDEEALKLSFAKRKQAEIEMNTLENKLKETEKASIA